MTRSTREQVQVATRDQRVGGALLATAGAVVLMGIITAEALYPGPYRTDENTISDLGASIPPNSIILQPSATIFDVTMMVCGVLIIGGAWFVHRAYRRKAVSIPIALFGIGALGVGVFPGNHLAPHQLFAMLTFISGGLAAILSARLLATPLRQMSVVLGAIALVSLVLGVVFIDWEPIAELGEGGIERWIAYPTVLWLVVFGGALMGTRDADA